MRQTSIVDALPKYKIDKPIRLIELFAGYGSTAVAAYRLQRDYIGFEIDDEYYEAGNRMNIFNLSFGKDSMATLLLALEQGVKVDRVMYEDIRFDSEISGEHPIMAEWIPTAEKILREKFGIVVDHAYSGVTYCEQFYREKTKGKHIGDKYGFPHIIGAWCNDRLKVKAIQKYMAQFKGQEITHFVGIAADEPKRWARMQAKETGRVKYRSLLVEQHLTEQDAVAICKQYNLLSPIYGVDGIFRGGCWFCPKQCKADLCHL